MGWALISRSFMVLKYFSEQFWNHFY